MCFRVGKVLYRVRTLEGKTPSRVVSEWVGGDYGRWKRMSDVDGAKVLAQFEEIKKSA